jgi:hypothetical protein
MRVQGRRLSAAELADLQRLIDAHPQWSRHRVAQELCRQWQWSTPSGQAKTFAARSLLLTLAQRHGLRLPALRTAYRRRPWGIKPAEAPLAEAPKPAAVTGDLASLQPLQWHLGRYRTAERERALSYLRQYHYLGCNRPVGAHVMYLVRDAQGRDLAVHLVGAAAWQCAARDRYLGWDTAARAASLPRVGNHSRFLILPWVMVAHLASHLLGELSRRITADWPREHGWSLEWLETFVEAGRFRGVSYRAAQWQWVGQTQGRTRQEKHHRAEAPRKDVWLYALRRGERRARARAGAHGGGR